jgi:predicted ester cyclase
MRVTSPLRPSFRAAIRRVLTALACAAATLPAPAGAQTSRAAGPTVPATELAARAERAERNKAVVERMYREAWAGTNYRVADELFAPNYVRHDGSRSVEESRETLSQGEIARLVRESNRSFHFQLDRLIAEGDYVVARWTIRAEPKGFMGAVKRVFGVRGPVEFVGANVARVRDGRIVEIWNHRDDLAFVEQVGMTPFLATAGFAGGVLVASLGAWGLTRLRRRRAAGALVPRPA